MSQRMPMDERRRRLVARHRVGRRASDLTGLADDLVAVHSSDPLTPHLAAWARVEGFATSDLDDHLYRRRALWRTHAMRRTLFVVSAEDWPVFDAAAGRAVAAKERDRLRTGLAAERSEREADRLLATGADEVLDALSAQGPLSTRQLQPLAPTLDAELTRGSGRWTRRTSMRSALLLLLAAEGRIVRADPLGSWRSSQYRWARTEDWFGDAPQRIDEPDGRAALLTRYLRAHGPATTRDVRWWTGWTAAQTRQAVHDVEAVTVATETGDGAEVDGLVLPDDLDATGHTDGGAALLPSLDPTTMGWTDRAWYLGEHGARLFDWMGNAGPTAWWRGRVVGGWGQRPDGRVEVVLLEDAGDEAREALQAEADALTGWLDGTVLSPRFRTPLERELSA